MNRFNLVLGTLAGLLLLFAVGQTGCCTLRGTCPKGSAGQCVVTEAQQQFPHLLPLVADIFMHGGLDVDVEAALASEGITVAADILHCVVQAIFDQSGAQLARVKAGRAGGTPAPWLDVTAMDIEHMHDAANRWLVKHGRK